MSSTKPVGVCTFPLTLQFRSGYLRGTGPVSHAPGNDLSDVKEVILTHNHSDHVGGLMILRKEMMKKNPSALSVVHVARGIFYSRPEPEGEGNPMIALMKEYEATGGKFIEQISAASS